MSIRNIARWAIGDRIECGYLSTDDSPLSTEPLIDPPSNNCLATCKKADAHKEFFVKCCQKTILGINLIGYISV